MDTLEILSLVPLNLPVEVNLYLVPELSTDVMMGNTYLIRYMGVNISVTIKRIISYRFVVCNAAATY